MTSYDGHPNPLSPIDADDHESERKGEHIRPKAGERLPGQLLIAIEMDVKDQKRDHNGEYAIAERLQSVLRHRVPLKTIGQVSISQSSIGPSD